MNAKAKGNRNEHRTIALLKALGFQCTRSGASLGIFDVVAIGRTEIVLVQVKSNEWPRAAEMEAISLFACPPNCRKLIHRWRDRQRLPDVKEL